MFGMESNMKINKTKKTKEPSLKKLANILSWVEIESIEKDHVVLGQEKKTYVKGIKIKAQNIELLKDKEKNKKIYALSKGFDNFRFPVYLKIVKADAQLETQMYRFHQMLENEPKEEIRAMLYAQLEKMDYFISVCKELNFFVLVQDNNVESLEKKMEIVQSAYAGAGFITNVMERRDYEALIKQEFQNDTVNQFIFSRVIM